MGTPARMIDIGIPDSYLDKAHEDYGPRKEPMEEGLE
jgi:hypothetical protein